MFHESPGEDTDPDLMGHARFVVDLDPNHAAAGGIAFENKPAQVLIFQLLDALFGPGDHAIRVIRF